ncbi:MAG TPA: autoinducer binding domain-containing protein [Burkholderiales bacterium]|nr:autoinducer binding domain-containing protein [Burkholderiales bacterium]
MQFLLGVETESAFFSDLTKAAKELGFEFCAYGMRLPIPVSRPKVHMTNNYPANWQKRYEKENYIAVDPTVAHAVNSVAPLVWSDRVFSACRPFWEEARSHGLNYGWAKSCFDAKGVGGMLTLSRSEDQISVSELRYLGLRMSWLVHIAHEGMSRLLVEKLMPEAEVELSPREAEVLRWTAEGKTSSEVSEILNISERTVNFHVNNALVKLGAANKTAAAIKAFMLRLI